MKSVNSMERCIDEIVQIKHNFEASLVSSSLFSTNETVPSPSLPADPKSNNSSNNNNKNRNKNKNKNYR